MSEFGNETTTATLRLGEKGIELLLKLLRYLMENHKQKYDEQIKKEQLKQLKNETKREDAVNYLNEHRGLVAMKKLERSGEKLMPIAMEMTPAQLKEFNKYARMEGVTYAVVSNKKVLNEIKLVKSQIKELEKKESLSPVEQEKYDALNRRLQELNKQKENRIVIIREKDLELVAEITERMNQNIKFENIEQEMKAYENVGIENLSPEDKKRYQDLQNEKEEMKETEFDSFNDKNNDKILAGSAEQPAWEEMNFDRALSRVTDRKFAEGNCYVCDRSNPDNYMEVSSKREQSKDGTYFTNTEYKVFNQGVEQQSQEFSHGKFTHYTDSKGESTSFYGQKHWENMKVEIKEKGGFSDDLLIFSSKEDYLDYKNRFEQTKEDMQLEEETIGVEMDNHSYKDYTGIVNQLKGQLQEKGYALNEQMEPCHIATGTPVQITQGMSDIEKAECMEATNICGQIKIYEQLNDLQNKCAFIHQHQKMNESNFEKRGRSESTRAMYEQMRDELHKQEYDANFNTTLLESKAKYLQTEREKISSVKIVEEIQERHDEVVGKPDLVMEQSRDNEKSTHREENTHTQSKENWNNQTKENYTQGIRNDAAEKIDVRMAEKE